MGGGDGMVVWVTRVALLELAPMIPGRTYTTCSKIGGLINAMHGRGGDGTHIPCACDGLSCICCIVTRWGRGWSHFPLLVVDPPTPVTLRSFLGPYPVG